MEGLPRFVHLRVHSEYSLLEGAVRLSTLPDLCAQHEMPAVAVTDSNNLFGALEFSVSASSGGIQPIQGCQFDIRMACESTAPAAPMVLLAQNEEGYRNLLKLNSVLYLRGEDSSAALPVSCLRENSSGLICLTGGAEGPVGRCLLEGREDDADAFLRSIAEIFPSRAYVELQRHGGDHSECSRREVQTEPDLIQLAYKHSLPLVATNDVYFPNREFFDAHDALICISEAAYVDQVSGRRRLTPEHHFKSQEEMAELFSDLPEAVANTVEIARRCSWRARRREPILPKFADNEAQEMRRQAEDGLKRRLAVISPVAPEEAYWSRLEYELGVIESMGFAGYFLIVADFIKWAKSNGVPVGAGRGSGAGSLVAYALTITDLDPLRFDLLFERFLNPERVSMPDFDIDFCQDRRDEVISYVQEKYGRDRVAHIITFGAMLSRMAVRDIGRVLRLPYPKVDTLAKLIPRDGARNVSIQEALEREPRLREARDSDPVIGRLFEFAQMLEGLLRNASTHAAGVVIGDRPLDQLVPLYQDSKSTVPATQFSMKWVEQAGLVKFDFLGLKTLTIIKNAVNLLAGRGVEIDIDNLPLDDEKTFRLCEAAETAAVFQLESTGMKDTLRNLKPNCIEDIVALVALYRPGPMENIPQYCAVKNGQQEREKQHESIDRIVAETHGIMVYQEQVMQIAQSMAGYSLGEADLLRRAIGKKVKSDMDAERPKFFKGAEGNGVARKTAQGVWDLMARFAEYGFPKAHAAAYAIVSYQTAWLKANHPVEFMASVMNADIGDTDKLKNHCLELRRLGIALRPPCINSSDAVFTVKGNAIIYGLGALKNVGSEAMSRIARERGERLFRDLFDFADRIELKLLGKRQFATLAEAGAFDVLDGNRQRVANAVETLIAYSDTLHKERASSQMLLFGDDESELPPPALPDTGDWDASDRAGRELAAFGYYFSGHPLDKYAGILKRKRVRSLAEVQDSAASETEEILIAATVLAVRERFSKKGSRFAFVEISDQSGSGEVTVFARLLETSQDKLAPGTCLLAVVSANLEQDQLKMRAETLSFLDELDSAAVTGLRIHFNDASAPGHVRAMLMNNRDLGEASGEIRFCPLAPDLDCEVEIAVPGAFPVNADIRKAIASLDGIVTVEEF